MRILIELAPSLAKLAIDLVERGRFESMDALVSEALSGLLAKGDTEDLISGTGSCAQLLRASEVAGPSATMLGTEEDRPVWVWGMVNRVFPLKIVTRVAANLCAESGSALARIQTQTAKCAAVVGAALAADDEEHRRKRNDCRGVALPAGPELQKSKVRFAHHYVGRRSAENEFSGGAFEVGLLGQVSPDSELVAPTLDGWEFARLPNPLLDDWGSGILGSANLSQQEREFYVLRVASSVRAEREAFAQVLTALSESPQTPQTLAGRVRPVVAIGSSENVITTTRSGLLGRMADVGAIKRQPMGRSALYRITELGQRFLELAHGEES